MKKRFFFMGAVACLLLIILSVACPVLAEEILLLNGGYGYNTETGTRNTQAYWSIGYLQGLTDNTMFSITYLNEGHQPQHARDGIAPQIWVRTPPSKLSFALGAGPYLYADTIKPDVGDRYINHDIGVMTSASATWYGLSPFILQLKADYILGFNSYDTWGWTVGVGYLLGDDKKPSSTWSAAHKNEVAIYSGITVLNIDNTQATPISVEYRRRLLPYLEWSVMGLYEGNKEPVGRYGAATELWLARDFFHDRFTLGIGAGPYFAHDKYGTDNSQRDTVAGLVSFTGALRLTSHVGFRIMFHRVLTDYDNDADVFMGGLAIAF